MKIRASRIPAAILFTILWPALVIYAFVSALRRHHR